MRLTHDAWSEDAARAAIARICASAERAFDEADGGWLLNPQDDPPAAGARSVNAYWGATGVVWALRDLASRGAVTLARDYTRWIERFPERARLDQHRTVDETAGRHGHRLRHHHRWP